MNHVKKVKKDAELAVKFQEGEMDRARKLREEQDAIRRMFPNGW